MTRSQRLKALWTRIDSYVWNILVMLVVAATSAGLMNWFNSHQRAVLLDRFPIVRAQERLSCEKEYDAKISGFRALAVERDKREAGQTQAMADLKTQAADLHELVAYILRYMGDRAKVADRNAAIQLKEAKAAAAAAVDAKQKTEQVGAKVEVAVAKADEAASAVKQVDKKLETAVHPTAAVPPTPWIGNRR